MIIVSDFTVVCTLLQLITYEEKGVILTWVEYRDECVCQERFVRDINNASDYLFKQEIDMRASL